MPASFGTVTSDKGTFYSGSPKTFDHVPSVAPDGILAFVFNHKEDAESSSLMTGVSYGGNAMSQVGSFSAVNSNGGLEGWLSVWKLASPPSGTKSVSVTSSGSTYPQELMVNVVSVLDCGADVIKAGSLVVDLNKSSPAGSWSASISIGSGETGFCIDYVVNDDGSRLTAISPATKIGEAGPGPYTSGSFGLAERAGSASAIAWEGSGYVEHPVSLIAGILDEAGGSPAVLSSPTPSGTLGTSTTATVGATTDTNSGTLYAVLSTSNNVSGATASQIKAGNNSGGTSATHADDAAVSTTSPSVGFTGLTANTLYYYALVQNSAGGDSNVVSGSFTTAAAAITATKCAFTTQPANTVVGQTMANVQVSLLDGSDNLDSDNTSDVVIALQTGSGTLAGTLTRAAVAGVATFNDLSINTLNTDAVLRATSSGLTQADSDEFDITAGTGSGVGGSLIGSALISS